MLRAAGGQVRCGRCGEVFDALSRLAEDPTAFIRGDSPREMEARADVILEFPPSSEFPPSGDPSGATVPEDDVQEGPVEIARLHILDPLPGGIGEDIGGTDIGAADGGETSERSLEFTLPPDDLDRVFFTETRPSALRRLSDDAELAPHPESQSRRAPAPPALVPGAPEPVLEFTLPPDDLDRVFFADSRPNLLHQLIDDAELAPHPESQRHVAPPSELDPESPEPVNDAEPRFAIAPVPPEFEWRELSRRDPGRRNTERPDAERPASPTATGTDAAAEPTGHGDAHDAARSPAWSAATPRSAGLDVADNVRQAMLAAYKKPLPSLPATAPPLLPFRAWLGAAIVLGCVLIVQVVLGNRDWLAAHSTGAGVTSLFSLVGVPVSPQANLSVYQLRQWGVSSDPDSPGKLRVRASILNTAAQLEPYPLLRITLANRFGAHVGARAFEPVEYLGKPANRLLSPGERLDATLDILDPGRDAEGFEIDVCLRDSRKRLYCAGDAAAPR